MSAAAVAPMVSVWTASYPTEEALEADLARRVRTETFDTGTSAAWRWLFGELFTSHRPAVAQRRQRPPQELLPRRRTERPAARPTTALLSLTVPTNGPPRRRKPARLARRNREKART